MPEPALSAGITSVQPSKIISTPIEIDEGAAPRAAREAVNHFEQSAEEPAIRHLKKDREDLAKELFD